MAVWAAVRLGAAVLGIVNPGRVQVALILGVVGWVVWMDARRREEDLFLGNLGIPAAAIVGTAVVGPLLLELFLGMSLR